MFRHVGLRSTARSAVWTTALLLCAGAVFAMGGCAGRERYEVTQDIVPYTEEQQAAREAARDARYKLRIGDRFKVSFKYEPDLDHDDVMVMPDGYISMKGLNRSVQASGLTIDELDGTLETAYGQDYRNPDLSVIVYDIARPEIYVLGYVQNPGLYQLPENGRGIIQAVAMAGGFDEDAKQSQTVLMRAQDDGFLMRTYDLSHMQDLGIEDLSWFDLQPYDIVYVPRSTLGSFAYISDRVFGSALNITRFFWDLYALGNLDKINTIIR